jgi:hypothetical protein
MSAVCYFLISSHVSMDQRVRLLRQIRVAENQVRVLRLRLNQLNASKPTRTRVWVNPDEVYE